MSESDIDDLLNKCYKIKQEIAILEKDHNRYKVRITDIMDSRGEDEITGKVYSIKRNIICKKTISKNSVPSNIWDSYAKSSIYSSFYIKKRKLS